MTQVSSGQTGPPPAGGPVQTAPQDAPAGVPAGRGDPEFAPASPGSSSVSMTVLGDGGLAGNLVADPLIRFSGGGKVMVKLRVASSKRIRDPESGVWREGPVTYHDVVCWGQAAQNVGEHFLKGDLVVAVGVWQRQEWFGADGTPMRRTTLAARHVGLGVTFRAARYVKTIIEE